MTINDPVSHGRLTNGTAINAKLKLMNNHLCFMLTRLKSYLPVIEVILVGHLENALRIALGIIHVWPVILVSTIRA